MNKKIFIFIIPVLIGATVFTSNFIFAQNADDLLAGPYANHPDVKDLKSKIEEKNNELQALTESEKIYSKKIAESRSQAATLQSQLQLIDNQITKIELDVKTAQVSIDKSKLEQESLQFQINKENAEIEKHKNNLKEYLKLINKEDQKTLIEILLLNNSFSEFFNQINYITGIQSDLKTSIDRLKLLTENLELQKVSLANFAEEMAKKQDELNNKKLQLKEQTTAKETVLFESKYSEIKYQRLLSEAKSLQNQIDSSLNNIKSELKNKVSQLASGNTSPKSTFIYWPVAKSRGISTYFNDPTYPFRYLFEHSALDIRAYQGSNIIAPADGYVVRAVNGGYSSYSYVTLIHANGLSTTYLHLSRIYVKPDQFVRAGELFALSGGTPGTIGAGSLTTGPHLHFETRLNGIPVDPMQYLP